MGVEVSVITLDLRSNLTPKRYSFRENDITVGKSPCNHLCLESIEVALIHLRIRVAQAGTEGTGSRPRLLITDLGTATGTLVGNVPLRPNVERELRSNERVIIGGHILRIVAVPEKNVRDGGQQGHRTSSKESTFKRDSFFVGVEGDMTNDKKNVRPIGSVAYMATAELNSNTALAVNSVDELAPSDQVQEVDSSPDTEKSSRIFGLFKRFKGPAERTENSTENLTEEFPDLREAADQSVQDDVAVEIPEEYMKTNKAILAEEAVDSSVVDVSHRNPEPPVHEIAGNHDVLESAGSQSEGGDKKLRLHAVTGRTDVRDISTLNFEAVKLCSVKVSVTHRGAPLNSVEVDARQFGRKTTNASGVCSLDDIDERSEVRLTFARSKFVFDPPSISLTMSDKHVVQVNASELFALSGVVLHRGRGVPDVWVHVPGVGETVTDENGEFRFTDIVEGTPYHVEARKGQYRFESNAPSGVINDDTRVRFDATKLVTVSGVVTYQSQPVDGAVVDGGPLGIARTDAEGRYYFMDIPEGTDYTITLSKEGYRFQAQQGVA